MLIYNNQSSSLVKTTYYKKVTIYTYEFQYQSSHLGSPLDGLLPGHNIYIVRLKTRRIKPNLIKVSSWLMFSTCLITDKRQSMLLYAVIYIKTKITTIVMPFLLVNFVGLIVWQTLLFYGSLEDDLFFGYEYVERENTYSVELILPKK